MFKPLVACSRAAAAAATIAALLLVAAPTPAGAHGGDAHLTVDQAHPAGSSTHYILKMEWDDGDPISGKVVTATPTGPGGAQGESVTMQPFGDGQYQGLVPMPESGTWTVRFASTDPVAAVEATATMTVPNASTSGATITTQASTTTTTAAPATTTASSGSDEAAAANSTDDDNDAGSSGPLIAAALAALLLIGGAAAILYRRANRGPDEPPLRSA